MFPCCVSAPRCGFLRLRFSGSCPSLLLLRSVVGAVLNRVAGAFDVFAGALDRVATGQSCHRNACHGERKKESTHVLKIGNRRSEEHTSELQSLMRNSYAVFCLKKKNKKK